MSFKQAITTTTSTFCVHCHHSQKPHPNPPLLKGENTEMETQSAEERFCMHQFERKMCKQS